MCMNKLLDKNVNIKVLLYFRWLLTTNANDTVSSFIQKLQNLIKDDKIIEYKDLQNYTKKYICEQNKDEKNDNTILALEENFLLQYLHYLVPGIQNENIDTIKYIKKYFTCIPFKRWIILKFLNACKNTFIQYKIPRHDEYFISTILQLLLTFIIQEDIECIIPTITRYHLQEILYRYVPLICFILVLTFPKIFKKCTIPKEYNDIILSLFIIQISRNDIISIITIHLLHIIYCISLQSYNSDTSILYRILLQYIYYRECNSKQNSLYTVKINTVLFIEQYIVSIFQSLEIYETANRVSVLSWENIDKKLFEKLYNLRQLLQNLQYNTTISIEIQIDCFTVSQSQKKIQVLNTVKSLSSSYDNNIVERPTQPTSLDTLIYIFYILQYRNGIINCTKVNSSTHFQIQLAIVKFLIINSHSISILVLYNLLVCTTSCVVCTYYIYIL